MGGWGDGEMGGDNQRLPITNYPFGLRHPTGSATASGGNPQDRAASLALSRETRPTQWLTITNYQLPIMLSSQLSKPRHILDEIVIHKQEEVAAMKEQLSLDDLKAKVDYAPSVKSFLNSLRQNPIKPSIIAEVKKASPSKGLICPNFEPVKIAQAYQKGGASCISVLTDEKFFQGSFENLRLVRSSVDLPLLCKEFIIDPYQIYFARVNGADAVLLIAAILPDETLQSFLQIVKNLGMTALVEVHTLAEFDRVLALSKLQLVGINNRNLEKFTVDLNTTEFLLNQRRQKINNLDITVVSESGLYTSTDLNFVKQAGAEAVLIGESLVKQADVEQAVKKLRISL